MGENLARRLSRLGIRNTLQFKSAHPPAVRRSLGVVGERLLRELNGISCMELEEMPPSAKGCGLSPDPLADLWSHWRGWKKPLPIMWRGHLPRCGDLDFSQPTWRYSFRPTGSGRLTRSITHQPELPCQLLRLRLQTSWQRLGTPAFHLPSRRSIQKDRRDAGSSGVRG